MTRYEYCASCLWSGRCSQHRLRVGGRALRFVLEIYEGVMVMVMVMVMVVVMVMIIMTC